MKEDGKCYYCGKEETGREHVPPSQFFKTVNCDSFTVPSCDEHNTKKSFTDQSIANAFILPLANTVKKGKKIENSIQEVISAFEPHFRYTKKTVKEKPLIDESTEIGKQIPKTSYLAGDIDIFDWIKKLSAGILYSGIRYFEPEINWDSSLIESPNFFKGDIEKPFTRQELLAKMDEAEEKKKILNSVDWYTGWGPKPREYPYDIYNFRIAYTPHLCGMRHQFFMNYEYYCIFDAPKSIFNFFDSKKGIIIP